MKENVFFSEHSVYNCYQRSLYGDWCTVHCKSDTI